MYQKAEKLRPVLRLDDGEVRSDAFIFWSNTPKQETNTVLLVLKGLAERGTKIMISEGAVGALGQDLPDYVAVYAAHSALPTIDRALGLPEVQTLTRAYYCAPFYPSPFYDKRNNECLKTNGYGWTPEIETKVRSLYWESTAQKWEEEAREYTDDREKAAIQQDVDRCKARSQEVLGDLPELTAQETQDLVKQALDKAFPISWAA